MLGRIKWYDEKTQFGFITGENNVDYSFHGDALKMSQTPYEGMAVDFSPLADDETGNIQRLSWFNHLFFPDISSINTAHN